MTRGRRCTLARPLHQTDEVGGDRHYGHDEGQGDVSPPCPFGVGRAAVIELGVQHLLHTGDVDLGNVIAARIEPIETGAHPRPAGALERYSVGKVCDPVSSITAILEIGRGRLVGHAS